jgi:thiamine pyrophosphate-dependent acetolactate synthase large subunit-like protein
MPNTGSAPLARALAREGTNTVFFLMGAPILDAGKACAAAGIRMIDVRHEQAAAMMAHAHARIRARPAVCMAASGPGTVDLSAGLANALIDGAPVVALGGASPIIDIETGAFQEIDQLAVMRPVTKCAERVHEARRIPEYVRRAFGQAMAGKPGPVYLDRPGDVLHQEVAATDVVWPDVPCAGSLSMPAATPGALDRLASLQRQAKRPIIVAVRFGRRLPTNCSVSLRRRESPSTARRLRVALFPRMTRTRLRAPDRWRSPRRMLCWWSARG